MSSPRLLVRRDLLLFAVILALGASFRLLWITSPLLDAHRWRQVDTAAITRNLYEQRFNPLYPQIDWGGSTGYVESEFPLLPTIVATAYEALGPHDYLGRIVVMLFSTATIFLFWRLATELLGPAGGLAAAFLLAVSPAAAFFGRTFMPDSPMLFFWIAAVLGFVRYARTESRRALWWGAAAGAVAGLVKLPALMMLAPCAAAVWDRKGLAGALRDRAFLMALCLPVLVAAIWYWHAFTLYQRTGLTFGILVQPARTYPPVIAPGPWKYAFQKWSTWHSLTDSGYYTTLFGRAYEILLLPWGFVGALAGVFFWRRGTGRLVADFWALAFLSFVVVMSDANYGHDYYQLPIVPVGALYLGAFVGPAIDAHGLSVRTMSLARTAAVSVLLVAIALVGFYYSGITRTHFRPDNLDDRVLQAGNVVQRYVPNDALLIVVDDYGSTSPLLLYFAHRKGWSFDVDNLQPGMLEGLRRLNGKYFVTTVWAQIEREQPDAAAYLKLHRRVPLEGEPRDMVIFDLNAQEQ